MPVLDLAAGYRTVVQIGNIIYIVFNDVDNEPMR